VSLVQELQTARWFGGKSRGIREARIVDRAYWVDDASMCLVEVEYQDGPPEVYVLADRLDDANVARRLLDQFGGARITTECGGSLEFRPTHLFASIPRERTIPIELMRGEQSNTSIRFGDALILKIFRRVQYGPNPDVEVGWFLTEHSRFRGTPAVVGSLEYTSPDGRIASLALLQRFEPNRGDAWTTTLRRLRAVLDTGDMAESVAAMAHLGQTTADLHLALASGAGDFSPELIGADDVLTWQHAIHAEVHAAAEALARRQIEVDAPTLLQRADGIAALRGALKARHHGDYHLGQVLEREDGSFVIIDFEGEPSRPLAQRREKRSPLRDVAGMLRSFDYARNAALRAGDTADRSRIRAATAWYESVREAFLATYLAAIQKEMPALLPADVDAPLAALELEKAAYEVLYELNNRPDWLAIPLAALTSA
jgi:maltose alpha-D-glucosyltransferase/alpha-amylase